MSQPNYARLFRNSLGMFGHLKKETTNEKTLQKKAERNRLKHGDVSKQAHRSQKR